MDKLLNDIYYDVDIKANKQTYQLFQQAIKTIKQEDAETLAGIHKPYPDQQLKCHFIMTGLPKMPNEQIKAKFQIFFTNKLLDAKKIADGFVEIRIGRQEEAAYIIYDNPQSAKKAFKALDNLKFADSNFHCFTINQAKQIMQFDEKEKQPGIIPLKDELQYNFDSQCRSQYLYREGQSVVYNQLDALQKEKNELMKRNEEGTKIIKLSFSVRGKYLVLCKQNGIYLYHGSYFNFKGAYFQKKPIDAHFSPDENYMVSFDGGLTPKNDNFIIWHVKSQIKVAMFRASLHSNLNCFQFADDSSKLAIALADKVTFYNVSNLRQFKDQLETNITNEGESETNNSFQAPFIRVLKWLKDNVSLICICYEQYQKNDKVYTKVFIYDTKTRDQKKWRAWSESVRSGQIAIAQNGQWVAIQMSKFYKKNRYSTVIQIADPRKKNQQLEVTSIQFKDKVGNVAWNTNGNMVAVMVEQPQTKDSTHIMYNACFYLIGTKSSEQKIQPIQVIKRCLSNRVALAKNAVFFYLYNIDPNSSQNGKVTIGYFSRKSYEKKKTEKKQKKKATNYQKIQGCSIIKKDIQVSNMIYFNIDPSGRYLFLGSEKCYQIWTSIGELVLKVVVENEISDPCWRPRYLEMLSNQEEKQLELQKENLHEKYQKIDQLKLDKLKAEREKAKMAKKKWFLEYLSGKRELYKKYEPMRQRLLGFNQKTVRTAVYHVVELQVQIED